MKKIIPIALILLFVLAVSGVSNADEKSGTISGQLMIKNGGVMSDAMVYLYNAKKAPLPSYYKYWRVPDFNTSTDDQGRFSTKVPEGKYCLGAVKREDGKKIGPPMEGDFFFISLDRNGFPKNYSVKKGKKLDIDVIAQAVPYKRPSVEKGITGIEGHIFDEDGKPVEGALVVAFVTPTIVGKPLFASEKTRQDGRYILRVHKGGDYYLKLRSGYGGGPPVETEIVDEYGEQTPQSTLGKVVVKTGRITKGINLKGITFLGRGPDFSENKPEGGKKAEKIRDNNQ